ELNGSEQGLMNAQRAVHLREGKDDKGEERQFVATNQFLIVKAERRAKVEKHDSLAIGGKQATSVGDTCSKKVTGDVYEDFGGNHDHKVASEYHIKCGKLIVEADSGISLKVGGNLV